MRSRAEVECAGADECRDGARPRRTHRGTPPPDSGSRRDHRIQPARRPHRQPSLARVCFTHLRRRLAIARSIWRFASAFLSDSRLSWVCLPFATASSTLALPSLKYIRSGNERQPFSDALPGELVDLAAVQEQLPRPLRLVVEPVAEHVFRNLRADQPHLAVVDPGVGVFQVREARRGGSSPRCRPARGRTRPCRGSRTRAWRGGSGRC